LLVTSFFCSSASDFFTSISNSLVNDLPSFKIWQNKQNSFSNSLSKLLAKFPNLLSLVATRASLRAPIGVAIASPRVSDFFPAHAWTTPRHSLLVADVGRHISGRQNLLLLPWSFIDGLKLLSDHMPDAAVH
jgi:hypothetical protein